MRFSIAAVQADLRDAVRDLLARACPPSVVRAAWSPPRLSDVDSELWTALADMGLFAAAVPESVGGLGLAEDDLVPVLIELGYAAVPLPAAETMAVAAPLLANGDPAGNLADLAAGKVRVAVADAAGQVPFGGRADQVLVRSGDRVLLAPAGSGVPVSTVDGSLAMTRYTGEDGVVVATGADAVARYADRVELAAAAQLVGLGRRMLEMTATYVRARRQFGVPVGSFQAVKHRLADALMRVEFAEPAVLAAGWSLARGNPEAGRDVALAAVLATEAAGGAAQAAIQCHGAIGYTVEYDLHLYAKRCWALTAGRDVDAHLSRLAGWLGLTPNGGPE